VFAAVNNEEGLNAQIYNRCIGTRYCSNNCPYKVRRFNWFDHAWRKPLDWQLNPEVTVRCRGVMEKCTFCAQRIRDAEYRAMIEKRELKDGEITPACVQTCPAKVFTFGDLLDPDSEVTRMTLNEPRRYPLPRARRAEHQAGGDIFIQDKTGDVKNSKAPARAKWRPGRWDLKMQD
jgi:molybdopterin-containing oxidoreductase family iron-sulfur binding subunit